MLAHAESSAPYTEALKALDERYSRPYQFALKEIEDMEHLPPIRDDWALDEFAVRVQSLVGMLKSLQSEGQCVWLECEAPLSWLPKHQQERLCCQQYWKNPDTMKLSLTDFSEWLKAQSHMLGH